MKRTLLLAMAAGLALVVVVGIGARVPPGTAQGPQQAYILDWWTVDGGGVMGGSGGNYMLGGTAGQPDAGSLTGGPYILGGGFWGGGALAAAAYAIYLPLVARGAP